jgi:hypothetical protein
MMIAILFLCSILYLCGISQYNICNCNNIRTANSWFIHPSNGGTCIFGQILSFITCILCIILCIIFYIYQTHMLIIVILYVLSILWVFGSYFMNNSWLSIRCIPLAILWIFMTYLITSYRTLSLSLRRDIRIQRLMKTLKI